MIAPKHHLRMVLNLSLSSYDGKNGVIFWHYLLNPLDAFNKLGYKKLIKILN